MTVAVQGVPRTVCGSSAGLGLSHCLEEEMLVHPAEGQHQNLVGVKVDAGLWNIPPGGEYFKEQRTHVKQMSREKGP